MKQRILLTGATSGLGAGAALGLARHHHVTVAGETWQQVTAFRERATEAGAKLEVIKLDLLNEVDLAHAAEREVDVLVLNAAVQEAGSIVDVPMELLRRAFDINVFAQLDLARRFVPQMMKRKRGRIVWTSSQAGLYAPPFLGAYAATKHAIEAIASTMRAELNLFGIGVATINPGLYRTGFNETGAESHSQWSSRSDVLVPMPPAGPVMALQHDPQPMIDAMIDVIPDPRSLYRTMLPEDAVVETKLAQQLAWTNLARGLP
ncbi:MAG: SDR family oxidoreductase [Pseudolysinimonas sp.]|uniref:SDR family oxidoreductase n=1 Tax=Pseudolysinimonas sp. TaxID=2680009 RepID=UPI0032633C1A